MPEDRHRTVESLTEFIVSQYPRAEEISLSADDPLLENGIVDSLGLLKLVNFIEDTFGIFVSEDDLDPENFTSINTISQFIERKRSY